LGTHDRRSSSRIGHRGNVERQAYGHLTAAKISDLSALSACRQCAHLSSDPTDAPDRAAMRLLLVEDHGPMREMIADHLVEQGFAVEAVRCGKDALAAADGVDYDAVILD